METGVFIWTWLVSAAPQLGPLVLAELVDAWLWTIDTKRGLFASEARCSGPSAKLRPHLAPGEPEMQPETDPVEQIMAHRLWLGFFIDRFEVRNYYYYFYHMSHSLVYCHNCSLLSMKWSAHISWYSAFSLQFSVVYLLLVLFHGPSGLLFTKKLLEPLI